MGVFTGASKVADSGVDPDSKILSDAEKNFNRIGAGAGSATDDKPGKKKRGRPAKENTQSQKAQLHEQLDKLFEPKVWESVVSAPADVMLALTGNAHWNLSDKEKQILATTGSKVAQTYLDSLNPKHIILILFGFNVAVIYGGRFMREMRIRADRRKKQTDNET